MPPFPLLADPALLAEVAAYMQSVGWQPLWCPQRQHGGFTPASSATGYDAPYPTILPQPSGNHRLGFRVPPSLVILDVDHYEGKQGAHTLDRAEEYLGALPPTYKVTSRGFDDPSGRYIYRKPVDLDFLDAALSQFANDNGKTDIEVVRYAHRFSWAPGDVHHKNGRVVQCYDPDGVICLLPPVDDPSIPELPPRWVDYMRNAPRNFSLDAYTRPGDGPQWWLQQPDNSLSTDDELKSFAFNMMLSRVPVEDIYLQWQRVSHADDPGWPWDREDFDRHTRSQAQQKAAQQIAREDEHCASLPATEVEQAQISDRANEEYEQREKLIALREQRIAEAVQSHNLLPVIPLDEDRPQAPSQELGDYVRELVRGMPEYDQQYRRGMARVVADKDIAFTLAPKFTGYRQIGQLEEPSPPETLQVRGKDNEYTSVVPRGAVTVISGHRASGKTWVTATWAAQELRAGNTVFWLDFERQDRALTSKLRMLSVPGHVIDNQLRYTDALPSADLLTHNVREASEGGTHRVLVVVDAWRALQNRVMPGTGSNDGDAVEQVYTEYLTPLVLAGANLVLIDHMAKSAGVSSPASTIGAERKESAADYVILVDQTVPFSKRCSGFSTLTLSKVRGGEENAGAIAGYLWVPGEHEDTSATGITKYPKAPELRNWAPEVEMSLASMDSGTSEKALKESAVRDIVRESPLRFGTRELARTAHDAYPDLFISSDAASSFIRRMLKDGKVTKEEGQQGKYDVPEVKAPLEVHGPPPAIDPSILEHPEA